MAGLGGSTVRDIYLDWQSNKNEILTLINGSRDFLKISPAAQYFLVAIILLFLAFIFYIIGWFLY
jgi:hypothetical protein